jgi:hypothetical protein
LFFFFLGRTHCSNFCIIVQFHHAFSSLAPAALIGSLARQPGPAAWPGSLARQPGPAVRPILTGFIARARSLRTHRSVLQWQVTKLHARAAVLTGKLVFSPISPCFQYLHARAAVQQTGSNLFSCSYSDLIAP